MWIEKDVFDGMERQSRQLRAALVLEAWLAEKPDSHLRRAVCEKMRVAEMIKRGGCD